MTKEILKLASTFLGLEDVCEFLSSDSQAEPSEEVQKQINQLLIFMNYVLREITKDYYPLSNKETIYSNNEGKILYSNLQRKAICIKDIKNMIDLSCHFQIFPEYVKVENANAEYKVFYNYIPASISTISDPTELPFGIDYFIVCYGIASEFALSKGLYEEAKMWESKFVSALRSIKPRMHERRFFARRLK